MPLERASFPKGRLMMGGGLIDAQRVGLGLAGFDQLTQKDVDANIKLLKDLNIQVIGVGGHAQQLMNDHSLPKNLELLTGPRLVKR